MINKTLAYYNQNAAAFSAETVSADLADTRRRFLDKLKPGAYILDFGCGSGRDTKCFRDAGFRVDAADGSPELCRIAGRYTGIPVRQMLFQELDSAEVYDGIWACSSILHLPKRELREVICRMRDALRPAGIAYASFKYGTFEGERNGRYFTDFTEEAFREFAEEISGLEQEECWVTGDARPGREGEKWLNLILRKADTVGKSSGRGRSETFPDSAKSNPSAFDGYVSYYRSVIDQDRCAVVICGLQHEILYMNPAAVKSYAKYGGERLIGKNLLDCHGREAGEKIKRVVRWFEESPDHNIVYTFHNEKQNKDVYMVALREEGRLIGYYEKHEYRNPEKMKFYDMD